MSFSAIAARVLSANGYNIATKDIDAMDPHEICRITGLPHPSCVRNNKKGKVISKARGKILRAPTIVRSSDDVFFEGFDKSTDTETCHLHIDEEGLKHSLKCMDHLDEMVIPKNKIRVKYEFEFDDGPYVRDIRSPGKGITRKELSIQLAKHYQKFFENRAKYGVWVQDITSIGISAMSYNRDEKVYELNVDLTH